MSLVASLYDDDTCLILTHERPGGSWVQFGVGREKSMARG